MFWIRSGLHSISITDWLTATPAVAADPSESLANARQALLEALGEPGARKRPTLPMRIRTAADARSLWDLRADVMTVVSQLHGEAEGRRRVALASASIAALLPALSPLTSPGRKLAMQRRR